MNRRTLLSAPALCLLFPLSSACVTVAAPPPDSGAGAAAEVATAARPDWVQTSTSRRFPAHRYLLGVGSGMNPLTAENRAKALIAEVFSVRIDATTSIQESERVFGVSGEMASSEFFQATQQAILATTQKEIAGIRIAETWRAPDGLFWALAALDRVQMGSALTARIEELDQALVHLDPAKLTAPSSRLALARRAIAIITAIQKRAALAADLRVIASAGAPEPDGLDLTALARWAGDSLGDLRVTVTGAFPSGTESLSTALSASLAKLGLQLDLEGAPPDLNIEVGLTLEPPLFQEGWHWARALLTVKIIDAAGQAQLHAFEVRERKSSTDSAEAHGRLMKAMAEKAATEMRAALVEALK
ncbi:MAG: LPP20 family lipoprotein [Myxococcales bacterium]|jgi:hypothetical protein|nr:LPP20 family lipoprotein [Myxococcales bacterium]